MYPRPRVTIKRLLLESVAMMLAYTAVLLLTGNPMLGLAALLVALVVGRATRDKGDDGPSRGGPGRSGPSSTPKVPKDWR